jgi:hypothetical protein
VRDTFFVGIHLFLRQWFAHGERDSGFQSLELLSQEREILSHLSLLATLRERERERAGEERDAQAERSALFHVRVHLFRGERRAALSLLPARERERVLSLSLMILAMVLVRKGSGIL